MATVNDLGGVKAAGLLVKSSDWNSIVNEIVRLGAEKADQDDFAALDDLVRNTIQPELATKASQADLSALQQTILNTLQPAIAQLVTRVTALEQWRDRHFLLVLTTTQQRYAVGNVAEITARLHDTQNNPLTFPNAATRPFIDFVASWGRLQAAPGFVGTGSAQSRALAVRVDQNGIARVLVRAEADRGFFGNDLVVMQQVLARPVPGPGGGASVEQVILTSGTAGEARSKGAFTVVDDEYRGNAGTRKVVDGLFKNQLQDGFLVEDTALDFFTDYSTTVMAMAKADNDPSTPDAARGSSSIQITFRDWTGPFVVIPFEPLPPVPPKWLKDLIDLDIVIATPPTGPRPGIVDVIDKAIDVVVSQPGEVGRARSIRQAIRWLDEASPGGGRPVATDAMAQTQGALVLVNQVDQGRVSPPAGKGGVGALVTMSARNESRTNQLGVQVTAANEGTKAVQLQLAQVGTQVATLNGQLQATVSEGGTLSVALNQVGALNTRVDAFDLERFKPTETRVDDINNTVFQLVERLAILENK
jgi:hypothetical protein